MSSLRRAWVAWSVAAAVLVAGGATVGSSRADWTRVRSDLGDVEQRLATLMGKIDQMDEQIARLDVEVDRLSDGVADCVRKIHQRVRENNRLARDLRNTTITSPAQLDPYVDRFENLRDGTRQDLKRCREVSRVTLLARREGERISESV